VTPAEIIRSSASPGVFAEAESHVISPQLRLIDRPSRLARPAVRLGGSTRPRPHRAGGAGAVRNQAQGSAGASSNLQGWPHRGGPPIRRRQLQGPAQPFEQQFAGC